MIDLSALREIVLIVKVRINKISALLLFISTTDKASEKTDKSNYVFFHPGSGIIII